MHCIRAPIDMHTVLLPLRGLCLSGSNFSLFFYTPVSVVNNKYWFICQMPWYLVYEDGMSSVSFCVYTPIEAYNNFTFEV